MKIYTVVGFLGRKHGLNGLQALIESDRYTPITVFTHRRKATFEDSERNERPDYKDYVNLCQKYNVSLYTIDRKKDIVIMDEVLEKIRPDLITSISWRMLIPKRHLDIPRLGGINLHRGKLPEYKGNFPVMKALENREEEIYITAHELNEEIDGGVVLNEVRHLANYDESKSLDENVERIKEELTPYFGSLLIASLDKMVNKYE